MNQLRSVGALLGLDCQDSSCLFAKDLGGMRTNGGCRCDLPAAVAALQKERNDAMVGSLLAADKRGQPIPCTACEAMACEHGIMERERDETDRDIWNLEDRLWPIVDKSEKDPLVIRRQIEEALNASSTTRPSLFQLKDFISAAGLPLDWKIECDCLTDEDWAVIAKVGAKHLPPFGKVVGVPTGGLKLANAMEKYIIASSNLVLVVDDVYTTGKSIIEYMEKFNNWPSQDVYGFVAFNRAHQDHIPACDRDGNEYGIDSFARIETL